MMPKEQLNVDKEPREVAPGGPDAAVEEPEDDTEGHFLLPDSGAARILATSRSQDIEREIRERQREKQARPNDKRGR
jgi:hypothetical protein